MACLETLVFKRSNFSTLVTCHNYYYVRDVSSENEKALNESIKKSRLKWPVLRPTDSDALGSESEVERARLVQPKKVCFYCYYDQFLMLFISYVVNPVFLLRSLICVDLNEKTIEHRDFN